MPFGVVSGVRRVMTVLDGGGDRDASHCKQWGRRRDPPKLFCGGPVRNLSGGIVLLNLSAVFAEAAPTAAARSWTPRRPVAVTAAGVVVTQPSTQPINHGGYHRRRLFDTVRSRCGGCRRLAASRRP